MATITTEVSPRTMRKRASKKPVVSALAICPVDGAGWCPYPFSPAQLQRRLKQKMEAAESAKPQEVTSRKTRSRATRARSR